MKKFLAMTMAILMMLALSAAAETRTALVEVNGELMELEENAWKDRIIVNIFNTIIVIFHILMVEIKCL